MWGMMNNGVSLRAVVTRQLVATKHSQGARGSRPGQWSDSGHQPKDRMRLGAAQPGGHQWRRPAVCTQRMPSRKAAQASRPKPMIGPPGRLLSRTGTLLFTMLATSTHSLLPPL